jgi:hypothetical protein
MAGELKLDRKAIAELMAGPEVGKASMEVAQRLAGNANAVGDSKYEAAPAAVTVGWRNERRAGAVVRETEPSWKDARDSILLRVAEQMGVSQ